MAMIGCKRYERYARTLVLPLCMPQCGYINKISWLDNVMR